MAGIQITLGGNFGKLDELKGKAHKTAGSIKESFKGMGKALAFTGIAVSAGAAFSAIAAGAKAAVAAASDLGETISKTQAVFKSSAAEMLKWADGASRSFGQSKNQALDAAAGFGNLFTAMGIGEDSAAGMSRRLTELASDLASFNNTSVDEAIAAIGSGLRGEAEPMRRFGVLMDDATLKAQALASGLSNGKDALDPATKALAAYELILSKTATAQGDFQRTSDGLANSQRTITALISDMSAEIGEGLLPTVQNLANELKSADFKAIGQEIGTLAEFVMGLGSALGKLAGNLPGIKIIEKLAAFAGSRNPTAGTALPMIPGVSIGADGNAVVEEPTSQSPQNSTPVIPSGLSLATAGANKAIEMAKAAAEAERKRAEEKARGRAAAVDEYNLESELIDARIAGDRNHIAALEREKAIREEMKRLESAGFDPAEARTPAARKVDAEAQAADKEARRKAGTDEKIRLQDILAGKVNTARDRLDSHQFDSTLGAVSTMQRIGGGGGAVSSGLDYARQTSDLLREVNTNLRQLIDVSRQPVEV